MSSKKTLKTLNSKKVLSPQEKGFIFHDQEEKNLILSIEKDTENTAVDTTQNEWYTDIFHENQKKTQPLSLRLRKGTLSSLKKKALQAGVPYQVILQALTEQYTQGKIELKL